VLNTYTIESQNTINDNNKPRNTNTYSIVYHVLINMLYIYNVTNILVGHLYEDL